jgi:DNA-binding transcriptional LysR family regulator
MFETELLETFVMVAECGGFSRAADRMNSTQSTVSHQIKRLETQAERVFLNRTTRSVTLTEDGEIFISYARKFLRLAEDAKRHFGAPKLTGHVRLGASDDFATYSLPEVLSRFRRIHPQVKLSVEVGLSANLLESLDAGELDLVLGKRRVGDPRGEFVSRERLVWVAAHDYVYNPEKPLELAVYPKPCLYRSITIELLEKTGRQSTIIYSCPSLSGIRAAALAGMAVTPLAENFVTSDLRQLPPGENLPELPEIEFVLYRASGVETAAARELGDILLNSTTPRLPPWATALAAPSVSAKRPFKNGCEPAQRPVC